MVQPQPQPASIPTDTPARDPIYHNGTSTVTPEDMPYNIYLSQDPFESTLEIDIPVKGDHITLGIIDMGDMLILKPPMLKTNDTEHTRSMNQKMEKPPQECLHPDIQTATHIHTGTVAASNPDCSYEIHPIQEIQQLYFDLLNTFTKTSAAQHGHT
jgi:hypothetical protein